MKNETEGESDAENLEENARKIFWKEKIDGRWLRKTNNVTVR